MSIVLPGVADAAEHLDRGVAPGGQSPGERLRAQRGEMALLRIPAGRIAGPQRMDYAAAGELDSLIHVDTQMLDRLERTDRLPELLSRLRVFDGEVCDGPCGAERVGCGGDQDVVDHRRDVFRVSRGQPPSRRAVEGDPALLARAGE